MAFKLDQMRISILLVVFLASTSSIKAQQSFYLQWTPAYGAYIQTGDLYGTFDQFNTTHPWMEKPFQENYLRSNFRLVDFSVGQYLNRWRWEAGWKSDRYFFEAHNKLENPNAQLTHQYVRFKKPSAYVGVGPLLFKGIVSPGVHVGYSQLHLNTLEQLRSTRFNKRNQEFRQLDAKGIKVWHWNIDFHIQFRLSDKVSDRSGGYLFIEPYYAFSLQTFDTAPFNLNLNGTNGNSTSNWRPVVWGLRMGFGYFISGH